MRSGPDRAARSKRASRTRASGWGGARANAGRPASGPIASEPHKQRAPLSPRHPVHVIARSMPALAGRAARIATNSGGRSRPTYRACYRAVWRAVQRSLARPDFRVVALVVRSRRIELVVEADSAHALARGMQGLQVSAARQLNRVLARTGCVFADRYRPAILRTRAAVRAMLGALGMHGTRGRPRRVAWPTTHLLLIELVPRVHRRVADPDP